MIILKKTRFANLAETLLILFAIDATIERLARDVMLDFMLLIAVVYLVK